jgi:hypothetical protein
VEHRENAGDLRSLGAAPKRRNTAGIDCTMRTDAHRGHQHEGHFPLSDRALPGAIAAVLDQAENPRGKEWV